MKAITHMGIDFGAKLAGTTSACWKSQGQLEVRISEKGKSADAFLSDLIREIDPEMVFLDAPLSLPGGFYETSPDFFFRKADLELRAMSPMFLGGLTARAIHLSRQHPHVQFRETYPKHMVSLLHLKQFYKNDPFHFMQQLEPNLPLKPPVVQDNWHMIDSILAWLSGWRFINNESVAYGSSEEGLIHI